MSRDVYIAIMVAAAKGQGLRLTPDEVWGLARRDEAIRAAALNGLEDSDWPEHPAYGEPDWKKVDPRRERKAENLMCIAVEDRNR